MDGTIAYYDANSEEYSERTFRADVSALRDRFLRHVPAGGRILDLGCGSGRDTAAFVAMGYDPAPLDGSEGMCAVAERNTGIRPIRMLFSELDLPEESFDGIWACSSLLHAPASELPGIMRRAALSLKHGAPLFVSFRLGDFEGRREGRHYTDMTPESLESLALEAGLTPADIWTSFEEGRGLFWCNGILLKPRGTRQTQ